MKLFWFKETNQKKLRAFFFFSFPTHPPLPIHFNYDLLWDVILGNSTGLCWKCLGPMSLAMSLLLCGYTLGSGWEKLVSPKYQLCIQLSANIVREVALFGLSAGLAGPNLTL